MAAEDKRIDGKSIAEQIHSELKSEIEQLDVIPGLAVVIVGSRTDSQTYVRMKKQAAEKLGMKFTLKEVPADIQETALLEIVQQLNDDQEIHGLIVQLPLPEHINEQVILEAVSYEKDVDGFHPMNIGTPLPSPQSLLTEPLRSSVHEGAKPSICPVYTKGLHGVAG